MRIDNLKHNYPKLLCQMETSGYSKDYISRFRREIQWILSEVGNRNWKCYDDVYRYYKSILKTPEALEKKHAIIKTVEQFDLNGKYPDSKWNSSTKHSSYSKLIPAYKMLVDYYIKKETERGLKKSSIATISNNAACFLFTMQETGYCQLVEIPEYAVMAVFVSNEGKRLKSHTYRRSLSALFKTCACLDPDACRKILSFLPMTCGTRKNIQYLTTQEVKQIREALNDMTNTLSKCDRAIGKLALYTGLRRSDIASLDLSSIDWNNDLIRINQQKTGEPLELPLTAVVGNAVYDYLTEERPSSLNPALFLTLIGSNRRMDVSNMWNVSARIMKAANVRQMEGDRKGFHLFRHHAATTLLGNEISQVVISRTLGHASPNSTETYLAADFVHLKECALSISLFPISEEVFNIG